MPTAETRHEPNPPLVPSLFPTSPSPRTSQVTRLLRLDNERFLSAGFDGRIHEYSLSICPRHEEIDETDATRASGEEPRAISVERHTLERRASYAAGPITTVTDVHLCTVRTDESRRARSSIVAAGFQASCFIVWDVTEQYQLLQVDCGGWRRPHDMWMRAGPRSRLPRHCFAFTHQRRGEVTLSVHSSSCLWEHCPEQRPPFCEYNVAFPFHGHTVTSVSWAIAPRRGEAPSTALVLTASEDCHVKLLEVACDRLAVGADAAEVPYRLVQTMDPHPSSVRALTVSRHVGATSALVASAGGKLLLRTWALRDESARAPGSEPTSHPSLSTPVHQLHTRRLSPAAVQDHRILALTSFPLRRPGMHAIIAGDSTGKISLFAIHEADLSEGRTVGEMNFDSKPVLALDSAVITLNSADDTPTYLLAGGFTTGQVVLWDVTALLGGAQDNAAPSEPCGAECAHELAAYSAHEMGVNAVCMRRDERCARDCRIVLCSGGDDQAIATAFIDLAFPREAGGGQAPLRCTQSSVEVATCACGSAVKGLALPRDDVLVSVSCDQRLSVWRVDPPAAATASGAAPRVVDAREGGKSMLSWKAACLVDVTEVSAMSCAPEADGQCVLVAVVGQGAQMLRLRIADP